VSYHSCHILVTLYVDCVVLWLPGEWLVRQPLWVETLTKPIADSTCVCVCVGIRQKCDEKSLSSLFIIRRTRCASHLLHWSFITPTAQWSNIEHSSLLLSMPSAVTVHIGQPRAPFSCPGLTAYILALRPPQQCLELPCSLATIFRASPVHCSYRRHGCASLLWQTIRQLTTVSIHSEHCWSVQLASWRPCNVPIKQWQFPLHGDNTSFIMRSETIGICNTRFVCSLLKSTRWTWKKLSKVDLRQQIIVSWSATCRNDVRREETDQTREKGAKKRIHAVEVVWSI